MNSTFSLYTYGVPQLGHKGVYLADLLFVLYIYSYINDLPAAEHLQHSLTLMFADDTKYIIIKHICNVTDCAHALLQDDIRTSCCTIKLLL